MQCPQRLTALDHFIRASGFLARLLKAFCDNGIYDGVVPLYTVDKEIRYLYRGQFPLTDIASKLFSGLVQHTPVTPSSSFYWTLEGSTITLPVEITR